jgi:hypothetical protein
MVFTGVADAFAIFVGQSGHGIWFAFSNGAQPGNADL